MTCHSMAQVPVKPDNYRMTPSPDALVAVCNNFVNFAGNIPDSGPFLHD